MLVVRDGALVTRLLKSSGQKKIRVRTKALKM